MPNPHNLPVVLDNQSPTYRTFMVHALDPEGAHGLVGRINVANVVEGAFRSATVGYDSYDPYAGRGLFVEGLRLTLDLVFADPPLGMGLHRVEANIQPANHRSAGLVRSLGFVHEGFSRDFLHLPGLDGRRDWRDHDRFTMLSTDWPAAPVPSARPPPDRLRRHRTRRPSGPAHTGLTAATAARAWPRPSPPSSACRSTRRRHRREPGHPLRAAPRVTGRWGRRVPAPRPRAADGPGPSGLRALRACRCSRGHDVSRREVVRHALAVRAAYA